MGHGDGARRGKERRRRQRAEGQGEGKGRVQGRTVNFCYGTPRKAGSGRRDKKASPQVAAPENDSSWPFFYSVLSVPPPPLSLSPSPPPPRHPRPTTPRRAENHRENRAARGGGRSQRLSSSQRCSLKFVGHLDRVMETKRETGERYLDEGGTGGGTREPLVKAASLIGSSPEPVIAAAALAHAESRQA